MTVSNNIQETIRGCLAREPRAQRALVDRYSGMLFAICKRYVKDTDTAKDMMQDSLIRIFENLGKYDMDKGSFESWISTISIRVCLSRLRKKNIKVVSIDQAQVNHETPTIQSEALMHYDTKILIQFISELSDSYRAVFNLSAIDGYSHKEISTLLNITEIASRTKLNRAKNMLKKRVLALQKNESWVNTI